ncbi:MAG: RelA/SpoT domain-containing protein [Puniceicoccales bacterium]|jgi:ppGpp synthetase/RelA/SpoT-type nucleotidyltranferase|nr:RelA/SpoT domain-containing protein [Puniceicoccales bacterium]
MTEAELKPLYEQRLPALQAFGCWVTAFIASELQKKLGSNEEVEKFLKIPPKPRIKTVDSFLEKALLRKPKPDPLNDITDQVGVRFVVLLLENIDTIGSIIQHGNWSWSKDRDHEKERLEKPDYFAYQSDHYIIRCREEIDYNGIKIPANTPCEIQIRTILQHAYAEMAHGCDYKPSIDLPTEEKLKIKRSLAKGSALIETTDDVFKEIKNRLTNYSASITALIQHSAQIYRDKTDLNTNISTRFTEITVDTYREIFLNLTCEQLSTWTANHTHLIDALLAKRESSVFYRDPAIVLLSWLVYNYPSTIPITWPVDISILEDLYTTLGISTHGIF